MKFKLINDVLNIIVPNGEIPDIRNKFSNTNPEVLGNFDVLYDEEQACCELNDKEYREQKARGGIVPLVSNETSLSLEIRKTFFFIWIFLLYFEYRIKKERKRERERHAHRQTLTNRFIL